MRGGGDTRMNWFHIPPLFFVCDMYIGKKRVEEEEGWNIKKKKDEKQGRDAKGYYKK